MSGRLIVGFDGSDTSASALRWAADEAELHGTAVRVVSSYAAAGLADQRRAGAGAVEAPGVQHMREACLDRLRAVVDEEVAQHRYVPFDYGVAAEQASTMLLREAELDDVLVVGSSGSGTGQPFMLGSVAAAVLADSACPVVVVPAKHHCPGNRIVVGVDGSAPSDAALRWAADEADRRRVDLVVVHAWDYPYPVVSSEEFASGHDIAQVDAALVLDDAVRTARERCGVTVVANLVHGSAAQLLLDAAETADLVVVGTRGRGGFRQMMFGSVAQAVATHASAPVVVVRSDAHHSLHWRNSMSSTTTTTETTNTTNTSAAVNTGTANSVNSTALYPMATFRQVVVPCDGQPEATTVHIAVELGRRLDVPVVLCSLVGAGFEARDGDELSRAAARIGPDVQIKILVDDGRPTAVQLAEVASAQGSLMCLHTNGKPAIAEALFGSIGEAVIRLSRRPLVVIGPRCAPQFAGDRMLIAIDEDLERGTKDCAWLAAAHDLAGSVQLRPQYVTIVEHDSRAEDGDEALVPPDGLRHERRPGAGHVVQRVVSRSAPARVLTGLSGRAEVAMIAADVHSAGVLDRLRAGSTTLTLIRHAACPVVVRGMGPSTH